MLISGAYIPPSRAVESFGETIASSQTVEITGEKSVVGRCEGRMSVFDDTEKTIMAAYVDSDTEMADLFDEPSVDHPPVTSKVCGKAAQCDGKSSTHGGVLLSDSSCSLPPTQVGTDFQ